MTNGEKSSTFKTYKGKVLNSKALYELKGKGKSNKVRQNPGLRGTWNLRTP